MRQTSIHFDVLSQSIFSWVLQNLLFADRDNYYRRLPRRIQAVVASDAVDFEQVRLQNTNQFDSFRDLFIEPTIDPAGLDYQRD